MTKLLANAAVKSYIDRKEPEILSHLELVANTVSMEEAVQQQQGDALLSAEGLIKQLFFCKFHELVLRRCAHAAVQGFIVR